MGRLTVAMDENMLQDLNLEDWHYQPEMVGSRGMSYDPQKYDKEELNYNDYFCCFFPFSTCGSGSVLLSEKVWNSHIIIYREQVESLYVFLLYYV